MQESVRMCIYALIFYDAHIATPCNVRTLLSATESNWDLPSSAEAWEAPSAEKWFESIQRDSERGILSTATLSSEYQSQSTERLTLLRATQSMLSGKPTTKLSLLLSRCPFLSMCILANIDCLIRDFTNCYYRLPPSLPDPSAFHVLSQDQTRSVNAALTILLRLCAEGTYTESSIARAVQLHCWAARLSLCEPDDLLVSGITDTTVTAGLATTAHLILGSHVANRRATVSTPRKFADDTSMTVWDDLLKCLTIVYQASGDTSLQMPPWMIIVGYRTLMVLWRTIRRATADLSGQSFDPIMQSRHYFNPAKIILTIISERTRRYLGEGDMQSDTPLDNLTAIETDFLCLLESMFSEIGACKVGRTMANIMKEIIQMIAPED